MTFTIEPILWVYESEPLQNGTSQVHDVFRDGWAYATIDGGWTAQYEHSVLVTETGYELMSYSPELEMGNLKRTSS